MDNMYNIVSDERSFKDEKFNIILTLYKEIYMLMLDTYQQCVILIIKIKYFLTVTGRHYEHT